MNATESEICEMQNIKIYHVIYYFQIRLTCKEQLSKLG